MEEFIDNAKVVMGTLGHKLFEPLRKPVSEQEGEMSGKAESDVRLHLERNIKNVGKVEANGMQTSEGFVVLQGSHISPSDDDTIPAVIKERRRKARVDESFVLQEDVLFNSPSYAAMFVIGKSANGLTSWKNEAGITLKAMEGNRDIE